MRALVDTNLLITEDTDIPGFQLAVASVSWAELEFGIKTAHSPIEAAVREARMERQRAFFGAGLPFDDRAATAYGTICGLVLASGREVRGRLADLMIAATAAANNAAVITKNPRDFAGLEGFVKIIEA